MTRKKEREYPNHHMGKQTGYELIEGSYHIAPLYQERLNKLSFRRLGIEDMLASVTRHVSKDLEQIAMENKQIWDEIIDDIGLDPTVRWLYANGVVTRKEK